MTRRAKLRLTLRGTVATRPRMLNPVGTEVMRNRAPPVMLDGRRIGTALTEQYPDASTKDAVFEVEVDVDAVPVGFRLELASVRQSKTWPGPASEELLVRVTPEV